MNNNDNRILRRRKRDLTKRLGPRDWNDQPKPMLDAQNIHYEMSEHTRAIPCGGIGAIHTLVESVELAGAIDGSLHLLKRHLPYHESDHVLTVAYNVLAGGTCFDDIARLRNDTACLDALGAERIPAPTTAGDFARRYTEADVVTLMDTVNTIRERLWRERLPREERRLAILDVDGTMVPTTGECKQGMDISFKGEWGYHPLLVSLANTAEPLYLANRPGNRPSHEGAPEWIDRAVALVRGAFREVLVRGDTDFALTAHFDRWTADGVQFVFGLDAKKNRVAIAEDLPEEAWKPLKRRIKRPCTGKPRRRPERVKDRIVRERGFKNIRLEGEDIAEFAYRPRKCGRDYRVVVVRKNLSVAKGEKVLFDDISYFFYITNVWDCSAADVVFHANDRCDQENLIEQLKNGVHALRTPVGDLVSNWASMVMMSLAWTLKAWFALMTRYRADRDALLRMEFRQFLAAVMLLPCQIVHTAERIVYRVLSYNRWTRVLLRTFDRIRGFAFT